MTFRNLRPTRTFRPGEGRKVLVRFLKGGDERRPRLPLPTVPVAAAVRRGTPVDGVRATWFGHSTVYLEVDGTRVLCDPMWAERSSPARGVGPRRFHPPPMALDELPVPDVVVISHDHSDHRDRAAVKALAARGATIAVPLGVAARLRRWAVPAERIVERSWWEEAELLPGRLRLVCTPARHFSGRGLLDRNKTLWASWAIVGARHRVFFGGDGGLDEEAFRDVGRKLGPFELALLEIGAFDPAWDAVHLGPQNAAAATALLRAKVLLPIHWATFNLGLHAWHEPPEQLLAAARVAGVTVAWPRLGESFVVSGKLPSEPWWRALREPVPRRGR
jgi:L-ascorbate metabolism protein UlaG (beta-lactamase superfamily)